MIPRWFRSMLGLGRVVTPDDGLECKSRGLVNVRRINEAILSGTCEPHQLAELEIGAETISLNLKKGDTDRTKKGAV